MGRPRHDDPAVQHRQRGALLVLLRIEDDGAARTARPVPGNDAWIGAGPPKARPRSRGRAHAGAENYPALNPRRGGRGHGGRWTSRRTANYVVSPAPSVDARRARRQWRIERVHAVVLRHGIQDMLRAPSPGIERADTKSGWASTFPSTAKNARFPNVELLTDARSGSSRSGSASSRIVVVVSDHVRTGGRHQDSGGRNEHQRRARQGASDLEAWTRAELCRRRTTLLSICYLGGCLARPRRRRPDQTWRSSFRIGISSCEQTGNFERFSRHSVAQRLPRVAVSSAHAKND